MCQDGLVAHIQQALDFVLRDNVANPAGLVDGQLNEDVIALPGKQPAFLQRLRPGFRNEAIFHGRSQLQRDFPLAEFPLQHPAGGDDYLRDIGILANPM